MIGIVSFGAYVPYHRLERKKIAQAFSDAGVEPADIEACWLGTFDHNLGGFPWQCVSFISIVGSELS